MSDTPGRQRAHAVVMANPKLNAPTITKPSDTRLSCRHTSSTVNAAGHGIRPPVTPKRMICGVVTAAIGKAFRHVVRMGAFVGVLKILTLLRRAMMVMMGVFTKFHPRRVVMCAVPQREGGIEFMGFGNVRGGFQKIVFGGKLGCLP